ncbi:MAG: hypothetical protein K9J13_15125 [Saprospiraceae bacterium]|nr:hypothetical protein [Saprospiraceae bacterium]
MKKLFQILLFTLLYLNALGQIQKEYFLFKNDTFKILNNKYTYNNFTNSNNIIWQIDSFPNGKYVQIKDSNVVAIFALRNMMLNGEFVFYVNGKVNETGFYENGAKSSIWRIYNNGNLSGLYYYKNNVHSEFETYYDNGNKKTRGITIEQGNEKGDYYTIRLETHWYANGNKKEQGLIKIDSKCNTCLNCCKYKKWIYWHENGKLYTSGNYKLNKKDGIWHYTDSVGSMIKTEYYKKGGITKIYCYSTEIVGSKLLYKTTIRDSKNNISKTIRWYYEESVLVKETLNRKGKIVKKKRKKITPEIYYQ